MGECPHGAIRPDGRWGLLDAADWKAKWIGADEQSSYESPDSAFHNWSTPAGSGLDRTRNRAARFCSGLLLRFLLLVKSGKPCCSWGPTPGMKRF